MRLSDALLLSFAALVRAVQQPFGGAAYDAGLFTPFEDLHALSTSAYATLQHPNFPAYSVRIKESRFCDGEVQ